MKKATLFIFLLPLTVLLNAQNVELTPILGYTLSGQVDGYYGTFDVKDEMTYGGLLSMEMAPMTYVEAGYQRKDTRVQVRGYNFGSELYDLAVEHYQLGGVREFKEGQTVPFAKVSLGASRYHQTSGGDRTDWLFSGAIGLGVKYFLNDRVGIRLHTNLTLPMEFDGAGIFCGIGSGGGGCSTGVSFNVPLVHWDLGGGLIIKLPR